MQHVTVTRDGNVFTITMHRGEENRMTVEFCREMIAAYNSIRESLEEGSAGAVIVQGKNPKFWCTGADLGERETRPYANTEGFYPMIHTILDFPFPTIALINGHTFGGGCLFALAHDYRIMNSERGFLRMVLISPNARNVLLPLTLSSLLLTSACISRAWVVYFAPNWHQEYKGKCYSKHTNTLAEKRSRMVSSTT
jgi:enoyl-CoA hydratase/carnithine racemase